MYSSTFWFICSVASSVFRWYAVNTLHTIFKSWQTLFHRLLTNWVPQSETIAVKSSWAQQKHCTNVWATHSAVIFLYDFSIIFLLRQFVIIRRFVQPSLDNRSTTKSMNIFHQMCFNTGRGFKKPCQRSFQLLFIQHLSQFQQKIQTFCSILSQKNCYDKRASVTSLSECSVIVESCVYWISLIQRGSEKDTQCLVWKSSFSSSLKKHSVLNTLTSKTVKNDLCCSWIVWQSSLYNPSSASAFTHICLRSVISLNKFWSCMSTKTEMSVTVIEAACTGLLIISKHIICIIQCYTLSSERFIDTFCFCLNRASVLSFCLLSKYSMKKLYCNSIKDHLICHSVSFLTVIKYFRFLWSVWIWKLDTLLNSASHSFKHCMMISISLS